MSTTASKPSSHEGFMSNLFTDASQFIARLGTETTGLETQLRQQLEEAKAADDFQRCIEIKSQLDELLKPAPTQELTSLPPTTVSLKVTPLNKVTVQTKYTLRSYEGGGYTSDIREYLLSIGIQKKPAYGSWDTSPGKPTPIVDRTPDDPHRYLVYPEQKVHALELEYDQDTDVELHTTQGQHAFIAAMQLAFDRHYPVTITPDAIWVCLAQGFANHVNQNSERLREKFVSHEGKKTLKVSADTFRLWSGDNDWKGVISGFSGQIKENIGEEMFNLVRPEYSTTTPISQVASEIVLMEMCQQFFKYEMYTRCGIPTIHQEGTVEDWSRVKVKVLGFLEVDPTLSWWVTPVTEMIDGMIATAGGAGDASFWESWYNYRSMSGVPTVSGHIRLLFPYVYQRGTLVRNDFTRPVCYDSFPSSVSSAPVLWDYLGQKINLTFRAGLMAMTYTDDTGVKPVMGYAIHQE